MSLSIKEVITRKNLNRLGESDGAIHTWGMVYPERFPKGVVGTLVKQVSMRSTTGQVGRSRTSKSYGSKGGFWSQRKYSRSYVADSKTYSRRAVIKVRLRQRSTLAKLRAHVNYLQREGVSKEHERGILYDKDSENIEGKEIAHQYKNDARHFRVIISPEDGVELDLTKYTREIMSSMEQDLGTKLSWVAVNHYNTDQPHSHVIIRGVDDRGRDLVIPPDYISHGIRARAEGIATRELGRVRKEELVRKIESSLTQTRVLSLDKRLVLMQESHPSHWINVNELMATGYEGKLRIQIMKRLKHLESIGLANELTEPSGISLKHKKSGRWQVDNDLVGELRRKVEAQNLKVTVGRHIPLVRKDRSIIKFEKDAEKLQSVIGRLVGSGYENELIDRRYWVVEGLDGNVHYVPLWSHEISAKDGNIVQIEAKKPAPFNTKADENIYKFSQERGGDFNIKEFHSFVKDNQYSSDFDVDGYVQRHASRLKTLTARQLVNKESEGVYKIPSDLPEAIEEYKIRMGGKLRNRLTAKELETTVSLNELPKIEGRTFLDDHLVKKDKPEIVVGSGFGKEYSKALDERMKFLEQIGLAKKGKLGISVSSNLINELDRIEMERYAKELPQYYRLKKLYSGDSFDGMAGQEVKLRSGNYLAVIKTNNYGGKDIVLVPMRKEFSKLTKHDELRISRLKNNQYKVQILAGKQIKLKF